MADFNQWVTGNCWKDNPSKKARVNDCEDGRCIIHVCNTEKGKVSKFQEWSCKTALNATRIRRDTLLENQELIKLPDER